MAKGKIPPQFLKNDKAAAGKGGKAVPPAGKKAPPKKK